MSTHIGRRGQCPRDERTLHAQWTLRPSLDAGLVRPVMGLQRGQGSQDIYGPREQEIQYGRDMWCLWTK